MSSTDDLADRLADARPAGGALRSRRLPSPVGILTLVASPDALRAVLWEHERAGRVPLDAAPVEVGTGAGDPDVDAPDADASDHEAAGAFAAVLDAAEDRLRRYFDDPAGRSGPTGDGEAAGVALDPHAGTAFQLEVWRELQRIPVGSTVTYAELAERVGRPGAARAVGAAVGRNPWSILVPCHRVVGADGSLTGFAGGLDAKRWLLRHEGVLDDGADPDGGGPATLF